MNTFTITGISIMQEPDNLYEILQKMCYCKYKLKSGMFAGKRLCELNLEQAKQLAYMYNSHEWFRNVVDRDYTLNHSKMTNDYKSVADALTAWDSSPMWALERRLFAGTIPAVVCHEDGRYFIVTGQVCVQYRIRKNMVVHTINPINTPIPTLAERLETAYRIIDKWR